MRLIDSEPLLDMLEREENENEEIPNRSDGIRDAIIDILNAPTVEAVPVVHGRWIEDAAEYYKMLNERGLGVDEYTPYFTDDIACSNCLAKYSTIDNETQYFKFCPNCGAKMEGAEDAGMGIQGNSQNN